MTIEIMLIFTVFFPLLMAPVSYLIGRYNKHARNWFAILVTVLVMGAALSLLNQNGTLTLENICGLVHIIKVYLDMICLQV